MSQTPNTVPATEPAPDAAADTEPAAGARAEDTAWVAEIGVSPEWFALQDSSLQPPDADSVRTVELTEGYALIGRASRSRDVHPVIDAGDDAGCSRRHADLTLREGRWMLRDLTSVNGTHLVRAGASFPPEEVVAPTAVDAGDQILVGAWTRIVLRRA